MPPSLCKNELKASLCIINYLTKFSPMTAEVYEPLQKLISVNTEWSWNGMYQDLYDKAKI